jgi:hypothetical protein
MNKKTVGRDSIVSAQQYGSLVRDYMWCRHTGLSIQDSIKYIIKYNLCYALMKLYDYDTTNAPQPGHYVYMGRNQSLPHVNMGLIPQPSYYKIDRVFKQNQTDMLERNHVFSPSDPTMRCDSVGMLALDGTLLRIGRVVLDSADGSAKSYNDLIISLMRDLHVKFGVSLSIEHAQRLVSILCTAWRFTDNADLLLDTLRSGEFIRTQKTPGVDDNNLLEFFREKVKEALFMVPANMVTQRNIVSTIIKICIDTGIKQPSKFQISGMAKMIYASMVDPDLAQPSQNKPTVAVDPEDRAQALSYLDDGEDDAI